jgi:N-acetylneuraminate synthase
LKKRFPGFVIGYSDHTIPDPSITIPIIAVALGARIIEKHFTLDRSLPEDDHIHSADPALLRCMVSGIQTAEQAVSSFSEVTQSEIPARNYARRSLVAAEDIPAGALLTTKNIIPKRPGRGISPKHIDRITGKRIRNLVKKDQLLSWDDIEGV